MTDGAVELMLPRVDEKYLGRVLQRFRRRYMILLGGQLAAERVPSIRLFATCHSWKLARLRLPDSSTQMLGFCARAACPPSLHSRAGPPSPIWHAKFEGRRSRAPKLMLGRESLWLPAIE